MNLSRTIWSLGTALAVLATASALPTSSAVAQEKKPNIIVIMGDDVGWENIGAYHQGLMYNTTPNLDKLAGEGMRFTDYYAEPSCTAGRANFITGELPIRTGLTTVGQAGAKIGMPDEAPTIATALKDTVGPRNLIHSFATDVDDATVEPRWGKIGKQKIIDEGPLPPHPMPGIKYNMETVDEDILDHTLKFIDKAEKDASPSSSG